MAAFQDAKYFFDTKTYGVPLSFNNLVITATFTVGRKYEAGLGETIVMMPAPDLDSLGPTASGSRERTGIYKIELKIPLDVDAPADSRRIITSRLLSNGRTLSVEEPYTDKRYDELTKDPNVVGPLNMEKTRNADEPIRSPRAL